MIHTAHTYQPERLRLTSVVFFGSGGGPWGLSTTRGRLLCAAGILPLRNAPNPRPQNAPRQDQPPGRRFLP